MASEALGTSSLLRTLVVSVGTGVLVLVAAWHAPQVQARDASAAFDPAVRPEYREPVTLASKDGVLEVTLTARQGHATLDTGGKPVENMLVFGYALIRGAPSDGQMSGDNLYPAP